MPKPCWITPQETGTAVICPSGSLLTGVSSCFSDFPKNISVFTHPKSILELFPSRPTEGRFAIVTNVGHGMRWTRQRFARDGIAGRVGERPVSDQQRADERCCSVRRSRVVLTPRRWRQVRGVKSAQPGLDKTYPQVMVANKPGSPGRARRKPLKPLRAGMPGIPVYSLLLVCVLPLPSAHETAGATGIRRSPRPLWAEDSSTPRAHCAARS